MIEVIGYAFPNDIHIVWSLMIVTYPYVTGLVAGLVAGIIAGGARRRGRAPAGALPVLVARDIVQPG